MKNSEKITIAISAVLFLVFLFVLMNGMAFAGGSDKQEINFNISKDVSLKKIVISVKDKKGVTSAWVEVHFKNLASEDRKFKVFLDIPNEVPILTGTKKPVKSNGIGKIAIMTTSKDLPRAYTLEIN